MKYSIQWEWFSDDSITHDFAMVCFYRYHLVFIINGLCMRVLHSNFIDGEMGLERPDDLPKVIQLINRVPRDERSCCYTHSPALFLCHSLRCIILAQYWLIGNIKTSKIWSLPFGWERKYKQQLAIWNGF